MASRLPGNVKTALHGAGGVRSVVPATDGLIRRDWEVERPPHRKRSEKNQHNPSSPFRAALLALFCLSLTAACATEAPKPPPVGIPDRTSTACTVQTQHTIAEASGVFACRGGLLQLDGALVGGVKGQSDGPYTLFSVKADGALERQIPTPHRGPHLLLTPLDSGFMALSGEGERLVMSVHDTGLGGEDVLAIAVAKGQVLGMQAASAPDGGAFFAAATGHGVRAWRARPDGRVTHEVDVLTHPEMPFCNKLFIDPVEDGIKLTLRCRDAVPRRPVITDGNAAIPSFNYQAIGPPRTDIALMLDADLKAQSIAVETPEAIDPPPPRYETRRALTDQLPRPKEHRVFVLDGVRVDARSDRILSLACVGPNEGPAEISLSSLQCQ